jgi:signal transduction histidine kinase
MFDPEAMHRAILNVVTNAVDACLERDKRRVEVSTLYDHKERMARVRVIDTGSGIEKDDLERIFGVFVSRKGGRGTGLGLPVSQKILQEHGGRVRVESQPDKGSCFTVEIPGTPPHSVASEQPEPVNSSTTIDHQVTDAGHTPAAM